MKRQRPGFLILFILLGFVLITGFMPDAPAKQYYSNVQRPLVIAHQGGDGLWPGDTMYAFEKAVKIGVDVLEMDAHITKDGQIVLMHDEEVQLLTSYLFLYSIHTVLSSKEGLGIDSASNAG
jgi:glycerophosphoryl diester phosphodiesterase